MIDCSVIQRALEGYDAAADEPDIIQGEEQRAKLLILFPQGDWSEMTLERYALGQQDHPDTFCRWMEFQTVQFSSMKGGSARKHLIYKSAAGDWWFDHSLYADADQAWQAIRQGFVDAIQFAERGDWQAVESIPSLRSGPALLTKTISVYFPQDLLPINSQTHLRFFLKRLGEPKADDLSLGTIRLNRLLLQSLRSCTELKAWSTKQIERFLYSSFSPTQMPSVAPDIADIAAFIAQALADAGDERREIRRQAEDEARALLNSSAGHMTESQVQALLKLFNTDYDKGKRTQIRFSPAFVGQTANVLATNLPALNSWTSRIWTSTDIEASTAVGQLLDDRKALPSAGTAYPTMLAYLRDPDNSAVWLRATDRGLQRLTAYKPAKTTDQGRRKDYELFCAAAGQLMADYDIPPELLDYVLASAGRAEPPAKPPPGTQSVWLFQANPNLYDINGALSELSEINWVARQYQNDIHKGDFVFIWRSGPEAGIVATAKVSSEPGIVADGIDDRYVMRPGAFSKSEERVSLHIESVLPAVIRRSDLVEHAILKDLPVIKFANATNFRVSDAQDQALRVLIAGFRVPRASAELEGRVYIPRKWLQDIVDLLTEKGQVVFFGPPGTGKTFVALALAEDITRDGGGVRVVQFHPSYGYEDFVGGFRPLESEEATGVKYARRDGPLRELAAEAARDPTHPYVLIVDEINRGNIPKIFGELLFLLEYRQKSVRLQYWPEEEFSLPRNLFVVGTMNTADRSIALVDAALRRRFYFVPFSPTEPPVSDVLRRWLTDNGFGDEPAVLLDLLNKEIAQDEIAIGPSYFMTSPGAEPDLERIWSKAIMPLLEEYYYGTTWDRQRFSLPRLRDNSGTLASSDGESGVSAADTTT